MPVICITTVINADIKTVFDLSRSIEAHETSTSQTKEKAIGGKTSGLMELGESVTWRAKHFGIYQTLTAKITAMESPSYFADEMVKGAFKSFKHEHFFEQNGKETTMKDVFEYASPFGIIGKLADKLFLKRYMTNFLVKRNQIIKQQAEQIKNVKKND